MLANTEEQVSRIGELCGYESVYSLSRAFRTHIGIPPSTYRYNQVLKVPEENYRFRVSTYPSIPR